MLKKLMKWFGAAAVVGGILMSLSYPALADQSVDVFVNGNIIKSDQPAFLEEQSKTTYVPLRQTAEALHYQVAWNQQTQMVTLERDGRVIKLSVGGNKVFGDGQELLISAPVKMLPETNRCVVPLTLFADVLHCQLKVSATAGVGILEENS